MGRLSKRRGGRHATKWRDSRRNGLLKKTGRSARLHDTLLLLLGPLLPAIFRLPLIKRQILWVLRVLLAMPLLAILVLLLLLLPPVAIDTLLLEVSRDV